MPDPITGLLAGSSVLGAGMQAKAQKSASATEAAAAQAGIDEQRRQFDTVQKLLAPFVTGGTSAFGQQLNLAGVNGADAQRAALQAIEQGPEFAALAQQGETAILQNAAATGGLRGGNVQGALAQFRPQILSGLIEQQYGRLGGLATMGQNSATNVGTAGMQTGVNVGNLLGQQGAARAGGTLATGGTWGNLAGDFSQYLGQIQSGAINNPFGGGSSLAPTTSIRPQPRIV
jgi:hypothetical protein